VSLDLTGSLSRRRRTGRLVAVVVILALGIAAGVAWVLTRPPEPEPAASDFATAWQAGDLAAAPVVGDPTAVAERYDEVVEGLGDAPLQVAVTEVTRDPDDDARATVDLDVAWTLPGDRSWTYDVSAPLVLEDDGWSVPWTEEIVHPDLVEGGRLTERRTTPPRAEVVAADGTPLVTDRGVVDVGVQPSRIEELDDTTTALREVLELQLDGLEDRIEAAGEDQFVAVVTLRDDAYDEVAADLQPVPGTVFRRDEVPLAPTAAFARATLGQAGPVTAEMVEDEPDRFVPGDVAGLSGLQRAYDEQLAGQPGLEVVAQPAPVEEGEQPETEPVTVFTAEPEPGEAVTVTLDERVQRAADSTLEDRTEFPTALVAISVETGEVLAVANGPGNGGADLAMTGRYAPGSTFKVVTTAALLEGGLAPDDPVGCPATTTVDGRSFTNAEDSELGEVTFRQVFAESCNTGFVDLAADLAPTALRDAAAQFGLGTEPQVGVAAYGGEVPETEPGTDQAATAIGQGRILASPFAMAEVAATAARGARLPASLVLEGGQPSDAEADPLPDAVATTLPELMRDVVTDGSGSALADVPGGPVIGKTGTAEYGDEQPPRTHAWFLGAQGDLAFAVLVAETEDSFGGQVAAPIAADFLSALAE
jgi:cell division protein FtsI/penicillin-binding protein 2